MSSIQSGKAPNGELICAILQCPFRLDALCNIRRNSPAMLHPTHTHSEQVYTSCISEYQHQKNYASRSPQDRRNRRDGMNDMISYGSSSWVASYSLIRSKGEHANDIPNGKPPGNDLIRQSRSGANARETVASDVSAKRTTRRIPIESPKSLPAGQWLSQKVINDNT